MQRTRPAGRLNQRVSTAALLGAIVLATPAVAEDRGGPIAVGDFPSLQAALDAHPGQALHVPAGDYAIDAPLVLRHSGSALSGPGRIVQTNPLAPIVVVEDAEHVAIRDLTLTRPEAAAETDEPAVRASNSDFVRLQGLRVLGNHSRSAAIRLEQCAYGRVEGCEIVDYKRVSIDDRTTNPLYGYAFQCIDGSGIGATRCTATTIVNNRIIERRMLPTREIAEAHGLGRLTAGKAPLRFGELGKWVERANFAQHWHQGSAIVVTGPEQTSFTRIVGNYIENSAQGIDIHSDNYICSDNVVNHAMMGMKAMHGSRNGVIANNLFSHVDLWGIMLGPGAASHRAEPASSETPERRPNVDGAVAVTGNVIADFGRGHEFWNWTRNETDGAVSAVIRIERGQLSANPPITDVLIQGNVVTNGADEEQLVDGKLVAPQPRYRYVVVIEQPSGEGERGHYPRNIRVGDNLFEPGLEGVCNVPLEEHRP